MQNDGKIVVSGRISYGEGPIILHVVRFMPDGSRDTTFGQGGEKRTEIEGTSSPVASDVVVQEDGKILLAAWGDKRDADFIVVRYLPGGRLDSAFGTGGIVTTDIRGYDIPAALAVQDDHKIVAAGTTLTATNLRDFVLVRYLPDGTLDAGFGRDGKAITPIHRGDAPATGSGGAEAVAIDGNGGIIAAGWAWNSSSEDFAVARYLGS